MFAGLPDALDVDAAPEAAEVEAAALELLDELLPQLARTAAQTSDTPTVKRRK
jgi:hypothetical protein